MRQWGAGVAMYSAGFHLSMVSLMVPVGCHIGMSAKSTTRWSWLASGSAKVQGMAGTCLMTLFGYHAEAMVSHIASGYAAVSLEVDPEMSPCLKPS